MGPPKGGILPRIRSVGNGIVALVILAVLVPAPALAADLSVVSNTYGLSYKRDIAGDKKNHMPLYESLSGDAWNLGGQSVSFHFYGWGRVDLQEASGTGKSTGELGSAYLRYVYPTGNGEARLGRFFLTEGAAMEIIDGASAKMRLPAGFGVALFGGVPVEQAIASTKRGDSLYGGRLFFARSGFAEIGATYLREKGPFGGHDREEIGGDLWLRAAAWLELTGRAIYNQSTKSFNSQRYALRVQPVKVIDMSAGYESYGYKGLFQTALNPAFRSPAVDNTDKVRTVFAIVDWRLIDALTLEAAVRNIHHELSDPGTANRGEIGLRYAYNDKKDVAGVSAAVVRADKEENEYQELRAFLSYSPGKWRVSADGLTDRYKQAINGEKTAYQVVGSLGYRPNDAFKVSGDVTYTRSPQFQKDVAGLVRLTLQLGASTGGKK